MKTVWLEPSFNGDVGVLIIEETSTPHTVALGEDDVMQLYNELGSLCAKIHQRRADEKARMK